MRSSDFYPYSASGWARSSSYHGAPLHSSPPAIYTSQTHNSRRNDSEIRQPSKLPPSPPLLSLGFHNSTTTPATVTPGSNAKLFPTDSVPDSDSLSTALAVKPPNKHAPFKKLSHEEMATVIKSFLENKTPTNSMELDGISLEEFQKLRDETTSIPGWNKVSYVVLTLHYKLITDFNPAWISF